MRGAARIVGYLALTLAGLAVVWGLVSFLRRPKPAAVAIRIVQSVGPDDNATVRKALEPYRKQHPNLSISVSYRSPDTAWHDQGSQGVHLALRPSTSRDVSPDGSGVALWFSDFVLLAYNKHFSPEAPKTWADVVRVSEQFRASGEVRFGLGIPVGADGVLPFLSPVFWPRQGAEPKQLANESFGLLHELQFGLGLVAPACVSDCVVHEMSEGRLPFGIVGESKIARLRTALGDKLGLSGLPPLPQSGSPLRSPRQVFAMFPLPATDPAEAQAAEDLLRYLRGKGSVELAAALGKVPAADPTDVLAARVSQSTMQLDSTDVGRAREFAQSLWDRFRSGNLSVQAAAREITAHWEGSAFRTD